MKSFWGYSLLGIGFGPLIFKVFENTNISEWKQWIIFFAIIFGLMLIIEETKEEILEKVDEKIDERIDKLG